jgi:ubiquinone/menaquinone biosynthesis C-methylase UbiE
MALRLTDEIRAFWEAVPCGTDERIVGRLTPLSGEWFEQVESYRYRQEPMIHAVAQFTRHRGERLLEVGVGAGTDHLQWARAGALCHGVDLTDAAIETTRARLEHYGLRSDLRRANAETLPFGDAAFDLAYSWGVIHHAERPEGVIREIHRVLRPGGRFIGMLYSRRSLVGLRFWLKFALLQGRPWRSFHEVLWHHMESAGTRAYTAAELHRLFGDFSQVEVVPYLTPYDTARFPSWLTRCVPDAAGWFLAVRATK